MAHAHAHAHGETDNTYFLDQVLTILACGAVGLVAILMYQSGMLGRILAPMFFKPVLVAGVAILLLAGVRAVAVWQMAGARKAEEMDRPDNADEHDHSHGHAVAHSHSHSHGGECDHDRAQPESGECGHDHGRAHGPAHAHSRADEEGEGHEHSWAPWRYMVLAIPVFLYFLGLPRAEFSADRLKKQISQGSLVNPDRQALSLLAGGPVMTKALRKGEPRTLHLGFKELSEAAALPVRHSAYEGDFGVIRGEFAPIPGNDHEFTLVRWNMTCCRADAIPLETRIIAPEPVRIDGRPWVKVSGIISFQQTQGGKWVPVLTLRNNEAIEVGVEQTQDANAY